MDDTIIKKTTKSILVEYELIDNEVVIKQMGFTENSNYFRHYLALNKATIILFDEIKNKYNQFTKPNLNA